MKAFILKLAFVFAAIVGTTVFTVLVNRADQQGDSKWCHVTNVGDVNRWYCEYDSIEECQPAILNGGYCAMNPYWHRAPSSNGH
jgi:hypothetical protein